MFELGQTVFFDIRIFSLRKSTFIYYVFLQRDEDNTSSGCLGCWWSITRDEAAFVVDYLLLESRMF